MMVITYMRHSKGNYRGYCILNYTDTVRYFRNTWRGAIVNNNHNDFWRVSIFNNSSWGGWVTVLDTNDEDEAKRAAKVYEANGYETSNQYIESM